MGRKTVLAKKRGPRPTGKGVQVVVRLQPTALAAIDKWVASQSDNPTRAEAIRRLVELGLTIGTQASPSRRLKAARADRAKELAAKTIEKIIDPTAPPEARTERRRKLTRGPAEFRDARVDQPKANK